MAPKDGESEPPSSGEADSIQLDKSHDLGDNKGFIRLNPIRPRLVIEASVESHHTIQGEIEMSVRKLPLSSSNAAQVKGDDDADIE